VLRSDGKKVGCAEGDDGGALPRTLPRRRYDCERAGGVHVLAAGEGAGGVEGETNCTNFH
jgi:hypothetical protein